MSEAIETRGRLKNCFVQRYPEPAVRVIEICFTLFPNTLLFRFPTLAVAALAGPAQAIRLQGGCSLG